MTDQQIPDTIGKYAIQGVLGKGAMGVVYKGFDPNIERHVAVKVLHRHLLEGEGGAELEKRFQQEAKAAARCVHANIVTVFDFGTESTLPYIVMEYVEGEELKSLLSRSDFISIKEAIQIILQVLSALEVAHQQGVVHRDIKPANIILCRDGRVKVSDFGVARLDTSDLTSAGFMIGTPNYMSPEGLKGQVVDARSDLYSVGLLLMELLTRQKPYPGRDLNELIQQIQAETRQSGANIVALVECLKTSLQSSRSLRFTSAKTFRESLEEALRAPGKALDTLDTVILPTSITQVRRVTEDESSDAAVPMSSQSQWNPDILKWLETSLAKYMGPMAKHIVRKNSRSHNNISALSQSVAVHIPDQNERHEFLKALEDSGIMQAQLQAMNEASLSSSQQASHSHSGEQVVATPSKTEAIALTSEQLSQLQAELTYYVGPLAGRLLKKALAKSASLEELFEHLLAQIPNEKEKQEFLAKVQHI